MTKDTGMIVNGNSITKLDIFASVDDVLLELNQHNDLQAAVKFFNGLDWIDNVTGHAKAKLLAGMESWYTVHKPDDDFADYIVSSSKGLKSRQKVLEYINVQRQIDDERVPKKIQDSPMRELIPICNMLAQGYEPSKKEWDEIAICGSSSELSEVIRKVKGKKPRKSGMTIQMDREGNLYLYKGEVRKYVGFLDLPEAEKDEDIDKAIERIVTSSQIIRK